MPVETVRVTVGGGDGHYNSNGFFDTNAKVSLGNSTVGAFFRFTGASVPQGVTVNSATINFVTNTDKSRAGCSIRIAFEDAGTSPTITSGNDYESRAQTTQTGTQQFEGVDGDPFSMDATAPVQQVVNRLDWASGNAMQALVATFDYTAESNAFGVDAVEDTGTDQAELVIDYQPANAAPTADAGLDQIVDEGVTVNLDGTGSSDPDSDPLDFAWRVSQDGGTGLTDADISNRLTATPSFTAPAVTTATGVELTLRVTDPDGAFDEDIVLVTVEDNPPILFDGSGESADHAVGQLSADRAYSAEASGSSASDGVVAVDRGLSGTADAAGSSEAVVDVDRGLSGLAVAAATSDGVVTTERALSGSAPVSASADAESSVARHVSGTSASAGSSSGSLAAERALEGASGASSTSGADLAAERVLDGSATAASDAAGSLSRTRAVTGTGAGAASASGDLGRTRSLSGSAVGASSAEAELSRGKELSGTGSAVCAASGALTATRELSGTADASAAGDGVVSVERPVSGTASAASTATGELFGESDLSGSAVASSSASGVLSTARPVSGTAVAAGTADGGVQVSRPLSGSAGTASAAAAEISLTSTTEFSGTSSAAVAAAGALTTERGLGGSGASSGTATGSMSTRRGFQAVSTAAADARAWAVIARRLAGSASNSAFAGADLRVVDVVYEWPPTAGDPSADGIDSGSVVHKTPGAGAPSREPPVTAGGPVQVRTVTTT